MGFLLGGSWGLSKWVNKGDNWGYSMAYRAYEPNYLLSPHDSPSNHPLLGSNLSRAQYRGAGGVFRESFN